LNRANRDDVKNMDGSMDTMEPALGGAGEAAHGGVDRRTMLKAAVAAGTVAAVWVAPRVETLGFAPAAAAGTPCLVMDNGSVTINTNSGNGTYCPNTSGLCCNMSAGNKGQTEQWFFGTATTPVIPGCTSITVQSISTDCTANDNPDVAQMALAIVATSGSTCNQCTIHDIVYVGGNPNPPPSDVTVIATPITCASFPLGAANVSVSSCNLRANSRVRVRLRCTIQTGHCTPPTP
jgi:hypothetical protein